MQICELKHLEHACIILNLYNKIWQKFLYNSIQKYSCWCKQHVGILSMQSRLHNIFSHSVDGNEFQAPTVLSLLLIYITMWAEKVQFLSTKRFLHYQYFGCMCMYNIYSKPSIYWTERGGVQSCQMPITLNVCNLAAIYKKKKRKSLIYKTKKAWTQCPTFENY